MLLGVPVERQLKRSGECDVLLCNESNSDSAANRSIQEGGDGFWLHILSTLLEPACECGLIIINIDEDVSFTAEPTP